MLSSSYAVSGTEIWYAAVRSACGTEIGYSGVGRAVLRARMIIRQAGTGKGYGGMTGRPEE
eukprot:520551-Rhodomonas_salina.1